ncbi:hypothetical protein DHEL01_v208460 [Diaporthe helianthi]|uniref:Uncharacterized protein n=1 Tax=Diaporthe helianthi TaxID=158607 RepID=A0A2P5HSD9_DIAHE|nr:hypothetical protein DHEL01_v208460 [Diaporthe helianthi]
MLSVFGRVRAACQSPASSSSPPLLLIHVFSNGGSSSVANLYEQYAATAGPSEDKSLPPHVTIFDSSPGVFRVPQAVAFVSSSLSSFQKLIAAPFLYAAAIVWTATMALGISPNSLAEWYKAHNNHPGNKAEVRRVYIYRSMRIGTGTLSERSWKGEGRYQSPRNAIGT